MLSLGFECTPAMIMSSILDVILMVSWFHKKWLNLNYNYMQVFSFHHIIALLCQLSLSRRYSLLVASKLAIPIFYGLPNILKILMQIL